MTYEEFRFSAPKGIVFIATRTYGPKGLGDMTFRWVRFSAPKGIVFIATDRTWYAIHPPIAPEEVSVPRRALSSLLQTDVVRYCHKVDEESFSAPKGIVFIATWYGIGRCDPGHLPRFSAPKGIVFIAT